jgi:hypothetical protein
MGEKIHSNLKTNSIDEKRIQIPSPRQKRDELSGTP